VNAPIINKLPIPKWGEYNIERAACLAAELVRRGGISTIPGGKPLPESEHLSNLEKRELRARIEGIVADGFDLDEELYGTILDDFSSNACPQEFAIRIKEIVSSASDEVIKS
jgi:hypothetical protein